MEEYTDKMKNNNFVDENGENRTPQQKYRNVTKLQVTMGRVAKSTHGVFFILSI